MEILPDEKLIDVLLWLDHKNYGSFATVCKRFCSLLGDKGFWILICRSKNIPIENDLPFESAKKVLSFYWQWEETSGCTITGNKIYAHTLDETHIFGQSRFKPCFSLKPVTPKHNKFSCRIKREVENSSVMCVIGLYEKLPDNTSGIRRIKYYTNEIWNGNKMHPRYVKQIQDGDIVTFMVDFASNEVVICKNELVLAKLTNVDLSKPLYPKVSIAHVSVEFV